MSDTTTLEACKPTRFLSLPLLKQDIKANAALLVVCTLILCMITMVTTYASSMMGGGGLSQATQDAEEDFMQHLVGLAAFDQATGQTLSYDDFKDADDTAAYDQAFQMTGAQLDADLSVDNFEADIKQMKSEDVNVEDTVSLFEYNYALGQQKGVFSGKKLTAEKLVKLVMEQGGMSANLVDSMQDMDMTSMLGHMYYTVIGLLPTFLFAVIVAMSLVVDQVDRGSMAYVLSTPTKRSAVAWTQGLFMLVAPLIMVGVACAVRIAATNAFMGDVEPLGIAARYAGMYVLVEAIAGICFLASCVFNQSNRAMALGGGIAVWCFIASLLGMFGSEDLVNMGIGSEALAAFNHVTLVGLFDVDALATVGTGSVDTGFVPGLVALAAIAVACYAVGGVRFCKRDLPL